MLRGVFLLAVCGRNHSTMIQIHSLLNSLNYQSQLSLNFWAVWHHTTQAPSMTADRLSRISIFLHSASCTLSTIFSFVVGCKSEHKSLHFLLTSERGEGWAVVHYHLKRHALKHTWSAHTLGAVGSRHCGAWGAIGGSVPCSRVSLQSWTISARAETRTHNLGLQIRHSIH